MSSTAEEESAAAEGEIVPAEEADEPEHVDKLSALFVGKAESVGGLPDKLSDKLSSSSSSEEEEEEKEEDAPPAPKYALGSKLVEILVE